MKYSWMNIYSLEDCLKNEQNSIHIPGVIICEIQDNVRASIKHCYINVMYIFRDNVDMS